MEALGDEGSLALGATCQILSVSMSVSLFVSLSVSVYPCLSVCLSLSLSLCLSVSLSFSLSLSLSFSLSLSLFYLGEAVLMVAALAAEGSWAVGATCLALGCSRAASGYRPFFHLKIEEKYRLG